MVNKAKERYSFSKLSTFNDCKYAYWLTYIEHQKGTGNCFSSFGTEVHSIMERYAKGKLSLWDLASTYEKEFDAAVPEEFPSFPFCQDMRGLYYEQGLNYLRNFGGYPKYKILGVESQFDIAIDDWVFNGIIDLVYEDEQGRLVVHDYKSKSSFKNKAEQKKYARQLYLYSLHIKEKYGKYPDLFVNSCLPICKTFFENTILIILWHIVIKLVEIIINFCHIVRNFLFLVCRQLTPIPTRCFTK